MRTLPHRGRTAKAEWRCYFVQPIGDFTPSDWRQTPKRFRILSFRRTTKTSGAADAWRFIHNKNALAGGDCAIWAVYFRG